MQIFLKNDETFKCFIRNDNLYMHKKTLKVTKKNKVILSIIIKSYRIKLIKVNIYLERWKIENPPPSKLYPLYD